MRRLSAIPRTIEAFRIICMAARLTCRDEQHKEARALRSFPFCHPASPYLSRRELQQHQRVCKKSGRMAAAATTPKDGRSLPFGLQRTPACSPSRCLQPDEPLPLGTPLADQVAHALSVSVLPGAVLSMLRRTVACERELERVQLTWVATVPQALFSTFYATSLRYLGVSEILDWLEMSATVDAFILTGLEQGRLPAEIACSKNLEVGRGAFRSVIKGALEQDDEAWATSLREVGFSSGLSMAYEGIISQVSWSRRSQCAC